MVERVDGAVGGRHVEAAHGLVIAEPVGIGAHHDAGPDRERVLAEPVDPGLGDREAFDLHLARHAVEAVGLDDEVDVGVLPVEPRDGPLERDLPGCVEGRLAVVGERRRAGKRRRERGEQS